MSRFEEGWADVGGIFLLQGDFMQQLGALANVPPASAMSSGAVNQPTTLDTLASGAWTTVQHDQQAAASSVTSYISIASEEAAQGRRC